MSTVADQFAEIRAMSGVKRIFGVVGDSLNGITDSIRRQRKIEWIHVRHEVEKNRGEVSSPRGQSLKKEIRNVIHYGRKRKFKRHRALL